MKLGPLNKLQPRRGTTLGFLWELTSFGARKLWRDEAPEMAAALAYRTIFSLIPILVLSLVIVRAFAADGGIRYALQKTFEWTGVSEIRLGGVGVEGQGESGAPMVNIEPAPDEGAQPQTAGDPNFVGPVLTSNNPEADAVLSVKIEEFINRTVARFFSINFGVIAVAGILVLIYGALSLMIQIEGAFNKICRASTSRTMVSRLTIYWAMLTLGPIGLLLGFLVGDQSNKLIKNFGSGWAHFVATPANYLTKVGLTWMVLILAYRLMPNTRIRLRAAAIGALGAAVLWEFAKALLTLFVTKLTGSGGQMAVYGSLALIPIFLMWVYVTWLIVLMGLEVTYAVQTVSSGKHVTLQRLDELPFVEPAVGVLLVRAAAEAHAAGKPATPVELAARAGIAEVIAERVLEHLSERGLLLRVQLDKKPDVDAYVPGRPIEKMTAGEIMSAMHELAGELAPSGRRDADVSVLRLIRESQIAALRTLHIIDPRERPELGTSAAAPASSAGSDMASEPAR
jgi:membrane protein